MLPDEQMAQLALRWILDFPEVTTVIPGASKISQVISNVKHLPYQPLSKELHQQLRDLYDRDIKPANRGTLLRISGLQHLRRKAGTNL